MTQVALVGLGPIGVEVARALLERGFPLVGAADPAPGLAGRDLGELIDARLAGTAALASDEELCRRAPAGAVAVLCTGSRLPSVAPQIERAVAAGLHVVSTCEELANPWHRHPELARRLDEQARARGVGVLGTGVNPGLVMDRLALAAAAGCVRVDHLRVERVVDAARRRGPLRAKVGAGLTREEFAAGVAAGRLGHVGLGESAALVGRGLGLAGLGIEEQIEPVIGEDGRVLGLRQVAVGRLAGEERVRLELQMSVDAPDPHDRIVVAGDPPLDLRIAGGTHGDRATVGAVVNALEAVARGPAGLQTVISLPLFGLAAL